MKKLLFIVITSIVTTHMFAGLSQLRTTIKELGDTIAELRLKTNDLEKTNAQLMNENNELKNKGVAIQPTTIENGDRVVQLEKELQTLKNSNKDLLSKLPKPGQEDPKMTALQDKNTELDSNLKKIQGQLDQEKEKHGRATQMIADLKKRHDIELKQKDTEIDTLRDIAHTKSGTQKIALLEAEVAEKKEQIQKLRNLLDEKMIKDGLGASKIAEVKNAFGDLTKKSAEIVELKGQLAEQTSEARECKIKLLKASASAQDSQKVASLESQVEALEAKLKERQANIDELDMKLRQALKQLGQALK